MKLQAKQKGFTLTELAIVAVVIAVLTVSAAYGYGKYKENANFGVAKQFFIKDVPGAIAAYVNRKGTLTGVDKDSLVDYGLPANTPWGDAWTVTGPVTGVLTFTFPLTSSGNAASLGADLDDALTAANLAHINSVSYASNNVTVAVQAN